MDNSQSIVATTTSQVAHSTPLPNTNSQSGSGSDGNKSKHLRPLILAGAAFLILIVTAFWMYFASVSKQVQENQKQTSTDALSTTQPLISPPPIATETQTSSYAGSLQETQDQTKFLEAKNMDANCFSLKIPKEYRFASTKITFSLDKCLLGTTLERDGQKIALSIFADNLGEHIVTDSEKYYELIKKDLDPNEKIISANNASFAGESAYRWIRYVEKDKLVIIEYLIYTKKAYLVKGKETNTFTVGGAYTKGQSDSFNEDFLKDFEKEWVWK